MWNWNSMMGSGWYGGWAGFGAMHLLWWLLVIVVIIAVARAATGRSRSDRLAEDRALAILRERYARGEIDQTEFLQRKRDLGG